MRFSRARPIAEASGSLLVAAVLLLGTAAGAAGCVRLPGPSLGPVSSPGAGPVGTASRTASPTTSTSATLARRWAPALGAPWQIQLSGTVDTSAAVPTYDVDGFDTPAATVSRLRAAGRHAICYLNAGSREDWRPDAGRYPASVLGRSNGWPGERWVDIRRLDVLGPVLDARLRMCRSKGFEAVDPDNVDGYTNRSGFPLTAADQLAFNRWVAARAHSYGLSVGLKNDLDQVPDLVDAFDFAVNEQCFEYDECEALAPFTRAGKAVLQIEYAGDLSRICPAARKASLSTLLKRTSLTAWRRAC